ncbi:MAG: translation elongation factor Ts [Anaerolineae bacterium]|nr:translation elongation factor Ts [Anaerolineae bacterium]
MAVTSEMIKGLRERTGAGILDCKRALEQAHGDIERAIAILRQQGLATAAKKATRVAREGLIEAYVHPGSKVASLVEVNCETDFVARTPEFRALAHDLAMQVAAAKPLYVSLEDVPAEVTEAQRGIFRAEAAVEGKSEAAVEEEVQRRLQTFYQEIVLLEQPFIKDPAVRIRDLITQSIAKLGENIVVRRFARFAIGEE